MKYLFSQFNTVLLSAILLLNCNNETASVAETETAANAKPSPPTSVFEKLVGTWKSENGRSFERWTRNSDGTYRADVYSIKGTDTSWNEQARIYPEYSKWVYENIVKNQNDGKAVRFTSILLNDNSVQFSNPAHDFPTDVNYTLPDMNTLHAFIIGPNSKGGRDTIPFNSTRVQ
jgi:hypothetical protein